MKALDHAKGLGSMLALTACGAGAEPAKAPVSAAQTTTAPIGVPTRYDGHMLSAPVRVDDRIDARFTRAE